MADVKLGSVTSMADVTLGSVTSMADVTLGSVTYYIEVECDKLCSNYLQYSHNPHGLACPLPAQDHRHQRYAK